jgi:hypothetical protein
MNSLEIADDIRLRPFLETDIQFALSWYSDPVVLSGTASPGRLEPYTEETIRAMYTYLRSRGQLYIIELRTKVGVL